MPLIVALWTAFVAIVPGLVTRVLIAAGVSLATYGGVTALLDGTLDTVVGSMNGVGTLAKSLIGVCQVDKAVTVIFSALVTRMTFAGLTASGALKKVLWRPNQQGELF